jgi:hypothetical protein
MPTRRDLLAAAAALPPVLAEAQTHLFSAAELTLLRDLADTIIPRTDTPGAADAKVELHINRAMKSRPVAEVAAFRRGLKAVVAGLKRGKSYTALLTELSAAKSPFFKQLKDLTIDGYYTSKEGLAGELGWHGYTAQAEFKGCTHKEHQS